MPGIFFKYDISALKIQIKETHKSYLEFLIRIIGIVGGVFATTMLFNSTFESATEFICAYLCITPFNSQHKKEIQTKTYSNGGGEHKNLLLSESNILLSQNTTIIAAPVTSLVEPIKINISFDTTVKSTN